MPELPEVETVLRTLELKIKGLKITDINILYNPIISGDIDAFKNALIGKTFKEFKRRGKYLIFEMEDVALISHLRMEGKYYLLDENVLIDKHTHVIFTLDNGVQLRYHDVRKFGRMEIAAKKNNYDNFKNLGPEPFSDSFNLSYVKDFLSKIKKPIKEVLLDQSFVAGIGNIYADEILWAIKVNPIRNANNLTEIEMENLLIETRNILKKAIEAGGTTIRSYTSSLGVTGLFQLSLNCHTMKNCKVCAGEIKKIRVGGRGTYYCEECQK